MSNHAIQWHLITESSSDPDPKETTESVWGVFGDGEMDESGSLSALTLAEHEGLDNLVWVVNCNLQRLDGPVRSGHLAPVVCAEAICRYGIDTDGAAPWVC